MQDRISFKVSTGFILKDLKIIKYIRIGNIFEYLLRNRFLDEQNQASSVEYGFKIGSDRTGTGELKFDTVAENDTRYYEPRIRNQLNRVVFPDEKRSKKFVDTSNRLPKSFDLEYNDTDDVQRDGSNFFPQVRK